MGGSMFGLHRRKRVEFSNKFGDAMLGRLKVGLGCSKIKHCRETCAQLGEAKTYLDHTGASGSLLLRSYRNLRKPAQNRIEPEGKAHVKD